MENNKSTQLLFGAGRLTIEDIISVVKNDRTVALSGDSQFAEKIDSAVDFLDKLLAEEGHIYGVTTGYGDSCTVEIPLALVNELPMHLTRFHGCGLGDYFTPEQTYQVLPYQMKNTA